MNKSREERQIQITSRHVIEEKTEELGKKLLYRLLSGNHLLDNQLEYMGEQKILQA